MAGGGGRMAERRRWPRNAAVAVVMTLLVVGAGLVGAGLAGAGLWGASPSAGSGPAAEVGAGRAADALAILHRWDRQRAASWRRGDGAGLAALYVAGSTAGRRDVALLRSYSRRGLGVAGMRTQVLSLEVVRREPSRLVVVVEDRLAAATAVRGTARVRLPRDGVDRRRIAFVRTDEAWRVASVVPVD